MVLQLEMFVQGLCVESDKISAYSFSFNTLFSTWQQTEEYKVLITQFMLQLL